MLSVIMQSDIMLSGLMLTVIILSVTGERLYAKNLNVE
jgi:hypothetical protein